MQVIKNDNCVFFDVDNTLVIWPRQNELDSDGKPYDLDFCNKIQNPYDKSINYLKYHKGNIKLIRTSKGQGRVIIVWSRAGALWAEAVVKDLGLEEYVDYCMSKPLMIVDDHPIAEWDVHNGFIKGSYGE